MKQVKIVTEKKIKAKITSVSVDQLYAGGVGISFDITIVEPDEEIMSLVYNAFRSREDIDVIFPVIKFEEKEK